VKTVYRNRIGLPDSFLSIKKVREFHPAIFKKRFPMAFKNWSETPSWDFASSFVPSPKPPYQAQASS